MAVGGSLHWLSRESEYRYALRNAHNQMADLRRTDIDRLPPQTVTVGENGWVQLGQANLVPGSVNPKPKAIDAEHGKVQLPLPAGTRVQIDYRFFGCDRGEAFTVSSGAVQLENCPVRAIREVRLIRGETSRVLPPASYQLEAASGRLRLPAEANGKVVEVDYVGERISNMIGGECLQAPLEGSKLMHVYESYGREHAVSIELTLLKPAP